MTILDKFKEAMTRLTKIKPMFDPSTLHDEIAMKTKWGPAKRGGTNFCTHSLKEISSRRVEFKMRLTAMLFPGIFMLVGLGLMVPMTISALNDKDISKLFMGIIFAGAFFLTGFLILRSWITPRIFDLTVGYYWKGKGEASQIDMQNIEENCELRSIHAIQLLQEYCSGGSSNGRNSSYYSYEINLVLKSGRRLNVIDHGNRSIIRADAEKLSQFLDVPLWDATF